MILLLIIEAIVALFAWGILTLAILWHPIEKIIEMQATFGATHPNFATVDPKELRKLIAIGWPIFVLATAVGFINDAFFPSKRVSGTEKKL